MEYSIQELSRLSGVTTRALRWYDHIGLLKPSRVAESGYRYYGLAEVDRLQDILFYRALGVELPGSRSVWMTPPSTGWPRCKAIWLRWRRSGRGWTP